MSEFAVRVKKYYLLGSWDLRKVRNAVTKGAITTDEFKDITGDEYSPEE